MDLLPSVDIDPDGKFKYVQILVKDGEGRERYLVRGYKRAAFHADVLEHAEEKELKPLKKQDAGISWRCPGGGRIRHNARDRTILIYGYSQGFGRPDHSISCDLVRERYPDYASIEWSNEGY